jgi:hypothetical protein
MARPLAPRPASAVLWVQATLVNASLSSLFACGASTPRDQAPTCGPCCHGSNDPQCQFVEPIAVDARPAETIDAGPTPDAALLLPAEVHGPIAPTCGPCCHGSQGPECGGAPDGR